MEIFFINPTYNSLVGLFIILGIYFGKKLYGLKRKKRANEMEDEYEYFEGKINSISNE